MTSSALTFADRWRTVKRAPVRAADRARLLTHPGPRWGSPYTRNGAVVACWDRIIRWDFIRAEWKLKGRRLP